MRQIDLSNSRTHVCSDEVLTEPIGSSKCTGQSKGRRYSLAEERAQACNDVPTELFCGE